MKHLGMIYENDMPTKEQWNEFDRFGIAKGSIDTDQRFKPNGITDNIEEWEKKAGVHDVPFMDRFMRIVIMEALKHKRFKRQIDESWNLPV